MNNIKIVKGVEGLSVYLNDVRICGSKPWGGGQVIKEWNVTKEQTEDILKHIKKHPSG